MPKVEFSFTPFFWKTLALMLSLLSENMSHSTLPCHLSEAASALCASGFVAAPALEERTCLLLMEF